MELEKLLGKIEGFSIVRGDLVTGGIKSIVLERTLRGVEQKEIACSGHLYGSSQLALAEATRMQNKKLKLFYAEEPKDIEPFVSTQKYPHVETIHLPEVPTQKELDPIIRRTVGNGTYIFPTGMKTKQFKDNMKWLMKQLHIHPKTVWLTHGSGATLQAAYEVWPSARYHIMTMGFTEVDVPKETHATIYSPRELPEECALKKAPVASSQYYDAKMWQFIQQTTKPSKRTLIWNMAR